MQIKGKKVLITGAASGLGLAFARELLRNSAAMVVIMDIQEAAGESSAERLNTEFGRGRAIFVKCDVTKAFQYENGFKRAVDTLGGLDILINNAGMVNELDFSKTVDVNVTAVVRGTLLGMQQMRKDSGGKGGAIINIASVLGLEPFPQLPVYSATKHAVIGFSKSFAHPYHYLRTGVRVLLLCPGVTTTPLTENLSEDQVVAPGETSAALAAMPCQRVESVAHGLVYIVRTAQNGSIWISEGGEPVYAVEIPERLVRRDVANHV